MQGSKTIVLVETFSASVKHSIDNFMIEIKHVVAAKSDSEERD